MRTLRQLCAASVLTLMLALSAFAGEMTTTIVSQPPPSSTSQATAEGQMTTGSAGRIEAPGTATDSAVQAVLALVQSALSLI
jgi:hypothetical protein